MFVAFSAIAISAGAPPMLTLLMIAFTSNLCMSLTHYAAEIAIAENATNIAEICAVKDANT